MNLLTLVYRESYLMKRGNNHYCKKKTGNNLLLFYRSILICFSINVDLFLHIVEFDHCVFSQMLVPVEEKQDRIPLSLAMDHHEIDLFRPKTTHGERRLLHSLVARRNPHTPENPRTNRRKTDLVFILHTMDYLPFRSIGEYILRSNPNDL